MYDSRVAVANGGLDGKRVTLPYSKVIYILEDVDGEEMSSRVLLGCG